MYISAKTILSVSLLAAASAASAADQNTGGFDAVVTGAVGYSQSSGSANPDATNYSLGASAAYTAVSKWGAQLDLARFQQEFNEPRPISSATDIAGHIYYRDDVWLAGAFLHRRGYARGSVYTDTNERFLGVEGQLYRENMTLYGQLGNDRWSSSGTDFKGRFVATKVSYFLNDNMLVSGGIDLIREDDKGYKYDQDNYKLGVESRLADNPLSLFAEYMHIRESDNTSWKVNTDMLLVGVKLNLGKATLRRRDRNGAGLTPGPRVLLF